MKNTLIISLLLIGNLLYSQSISKSSIDSGGGTSSNGGVQIMYTIGEVNVQELSAGNIQASEGFINPEIQLAIKLNPTVFLQGASINPSVTGLMNDNLRVSGLIPTTSPFVDVLTCSVLVFNTTGNNAIIDWVYVELRDENDNTVVLDSQSALLQRDGDVVNVDGVSVLSFDQQLGNYFVSIAHRNHLGIITANMIPLSSSVTNLLLTTNTALIQGGSNAVADLGNGTFALYAGDYDNNGQIQNADLTQVTTLIGSSGYLDADADMNSQVQNADANNIISPNIGNGEQNRTASNQPLIIAPLSENYKQKQH
ncbi:MAG: hemagglutinin protein [Flavobacteriaceae bacterium]